MSDGRCISFHDHRRLDSDERRQEQPPEPLVELVAGWQPQVVADIGAGTGYVALPLARSLAAARVLCLDIEPRMLAEITKRSDAAGLSNRVKTVLMEEPSAITLPDSSVDAALLVSLYHELDDRGQYLLELRRVLRGGGHLLICDWRPEGAADHGPRPEHRVAVQVAIEELTAAGFTAVEEQTLYQHQWVVTAVSPGSGAP